MNDVSLFSAIEQHDVGLLEALLQDSPDLAQTQHEWPYYGLLHAAINAVDEGGPQSLVECLIRAGADVNGWDGQHDSTPLLMAVFRGLHDVAKVLLLHGADPNVRGSEGDSPIRWCAAQRDHEMARLLIQYGASKTIDQFGGACGLTALGIAAQNTDVLMVQILVSAGADPEAPDEDGRTAAERVPIGIGKDRLVALRRALAG